MFGPKELGFWSNRKAPNCGGKYLFLEKGKKYKVIQSFSESGFIYPVEEKWIFMGYSFLPYDNGLSLFVSLDGKQEWVIEIWLELEEINLIMSHLQEYIKLTE